VPHIPTGYANTLFQLLKNQKKGRRNCAVGCGAMNFHSRIDNLIQNSQQLYEVAL
jgi:hypothetical protein